MTLTLWDAQADFVRVPKRKIKDVIVRELRFRCPNCGDRHALLFAAMAPKGDIHEQVSGRTLDEFTFRPHYHAPCGVELEITGGVVRLVP